MKHWATGLFMGLIIVAGGCRIAEKTEPLAIARDGKTNYVIVESSKATEPEKYAARELAQFLGRVTGAEYPIIAESADSEKGPGIYVGWTKFADNEGINPARLGEEEWILRTIGNDLIITGGRPRGTMYGVYEFLEDYVGCHWLARDTDVIPSKPTLTVKPLDVRAKPWFWQRWVGGSTGTPDDLWEYMVRNKNYRYDFKGRRDFYPAGAFYNLWGSGGGVHSVQNFVNGADWFESHPEYFALVRGKRLPCDGPAGPGQLCLTNPEAIQTAKTKLRHFIVKDREEAKRKGCPPPKIYWISQIDMYDAHCQCAACKAIVEREGGESGPLITFINALAEDVETDYPEVLVGTIAYNKTATAPNNLRPRRNVLVGWCDVYSHVDGIRPLSHPFNIRNYKEINGWGKASRRLAIGDDYWTALSYYKYFPTPWAMIDCLASDLKLFADLGVESFFCETSDFACASQQFIPLKFWLAYQLLVDPHQPVEPLIQTFMDGYFGKADGKMREYLRYLRKRIDTDAQYKMLRDAPHKLAYLDLEFFKTSETLFDEAEALVAPESKEARHLSDERLTLDGALLFMWPWLERKLSPDESMPFDKEKVIKRYEREWRTFRRFSMFYTHCEASLNKDGKLRERMAGLFRDPQLPEKFKDLPPRDVADFNWLTFSTILPRQKFVSDGEATGGMTASFTEKNAIQKAEKGGNQAEASADELHRGPVTFGVTGGPTITLKPAEVPQDGKYHLHKIGRFQLKPGAMVWALRDKRLGVCVDRVYEADADDPTVNGWNAYISLKFQGPAYVKGSKNPNGVWMDRVLLVKPQPGEPVDETYKAYLEEERRRAVTRPKIKIPQLTKNADGDPLKVNWSQAANGGRWWNLKGGATKREISVEFACDAQWLYLRLTETMDPAKIMNDPEIWSGDDWEILIASNREGRRYRQLAVNPEGKYIERAYGEPEWKSGAEVDSNVDHNGWTMCLALPLNKLIPGEESVANSLFVNLLRGGKENLVWSPTFGESFHSLGRLGEIILPKESNDVK